MIGPKPDINPRMSAVRGEAEVLTHTSELPVLAEAVEKVGAVRFCTTIVPVS